MDVAPDPCSDHGAGTVDGPYGSHQRFTAYTSHEGITWTRGGRCAGDLGQNARIGLVAMGGTASGRISSMSGSIESTTDADRAGIVSSVPVLSRLFATQPTTDRR